MSRERMMFRGPASLIVLAISACSVAGTGYRSASEPKVATGATLIACAELPESFSYGSTQLQSARLIPAGEVKIAGKPIGEHCLVAGSARRRVSTVDGQTYAIGFEMRLPVVWSGRFLYQANGGLDGNIVAAVGSISGGGPLTNALAQGFAVISSDAGHSSEQNPLFGLDPQARLDYGYQAAGTLTPMAKQLIRAAYGKAPDRSYIGGCSNGGRHAMVAASRYADQFDGFLAGNPGFHLPSAALAQLRGAQLYARVATSQDLSSAFTVAERQLVADRVLEKCDTLDGIADGIVSASAQCQKTFDLMRDVPACRGERDGSCLSQEQKSVLKEVFDGATDGAANRLYASFPYDPGITGNGWASWKFVASVTDRDPAAVAFVFQTPPATPDVLKDPRAFALGVDLTRTAPMIFATAAPYHESAMSFMTPPNEAELSRLEALGGKLLVYHGTADPVFSSDDTAAWYEALNETHGGDATEFARYFPVPGMNHCRGGPTTDQFDMLATLVNWVEMGQPPERVIATARGTGNAGGVNLEVPASWAADRTRPLCRYPRVAQYGGAGDVERAENFTCR